MGDIGNTTDAISSVVVLGNNRIATSIITTLSHADYTIHQVVYRQETVTPVSGVKLHTSNFSPASLHSLFTTLQSDLLISTLHASDHAFQRTIITTALDCNIHRFIAPEFSHDSLNPKLQGRLPPLKERARTISHLRDLSHNKKIAWLALATGIPLDHGLHSGNLGFDIQWHSATLHGSGHEVFPASTVAWIGQVTLAAVQRWDELRNQYFYVAGSLTSANEVLGELEKQTGKRWGVGRGNVDECVREAERRISRGFPDAGMFLMERSVLYDEDLGAAEPFGEGDGKGRLGLEGEKLEDVVHAALHQYNSHGKGGCGCD